MKLFSILFFHFVVTFFRLLTPGGVKSVMAENILIKHQLILINRTRKKSPQLKPIDRFILGLTAFFITPKRLIQNSAILKVSTILNFHQALINRKYRLLFSSNKTAKRPGPKGPSKDLINAVIEMKKNNPRMGCPKIAQTISVMFGVTIDKDIVRRILAQYYRPENGGNGPSWLSFIGNTKDSLWSLDFFRVESINLQTHWVMVVMDQFSRRIIGFAVECCDGVDGPMACRMLSRAVGNLKTPKYISSDNDPLFQYFVWHANLRIMEIEEIKSVPYVPLSHPFIERLIGTLRREYLDHIFFWGKTDLERKLEDFKKYYNTSRIHASLKTSPGVVASESTLTVVDIKNFRWKKHCRGLFQTPIAA
ncbi:MAG: hypothetical protein A2504_00240 [Bdellovibrionales bacterium RIFOXYD12_FULL_39_22]|nr:MAG: hypothetical protein A2485_03145 [Bdellovibrionales bacterium RIFOXYC12_FULL_39_17]OFZ47046.1 MAG: hypothetical protein A2404_08010 [Bdellovibrionales bacterium RIFOXYC1_FULL_39_130]OFZ72607.1 MAG: hypothetical protein A2451_00805 [Bdellovibrionales bacterium RIFOXYC2_FULL_39_8]OFZ76689.1 MAG: hypothetical protein A2560_17525 [Bdellovibrionales bacterium RIFOXYD1_FULL_39_84]OFZ95924.1 MAG: hypothetical protein A2504_00240 [Bdellovibrionales bacterium RIFOXYD12_FULL_39_22]